MRSILWQLGVLGDRLNICLKTLKIRETLCQDGRPAGRKSYRMPTDCQPAVGQSPTDLYSESGVLCVVRTEFMWF